MKTLSYIIQIIILILVVHLVVACSSTDITRSDGTLIAHKMVGTKAAGIAVTPDGVFYQDVDQVEGMRVVGQTTSTVTGIVSAARVAIRQSGDDVAKVTNADRQQTLRHTETETTKRAADVQRTVRETFVAP